MKKKVFEFVDVDKDTPIQELSFKDSLRVVIKKLTYNPEQELEAEDAADYEYLRLKANLLKFFRIALTPLREGKRRQVLTKVPSVYAPVIEEVINSPKLKTYYSITATYPKSDFRTKFDYIVEVKIRQ